jgi:hypothetical protein
MGDVRLEALLRVYSGEDRHDICHDLGIEDSQLQEWEANTPTADLRPPEIIPVTSTLRVERFRRRHILRTMATQPWWEGGWKTVMSVAVLVGGLGLVLVALLLPMPEVIVAFAVGLATIALGVWSLRLRWNEVTATGGSDRPIKP